MLVAIDGSPALRPRPTGTEFYAHEMISALAAAGSLHTIRVYANAAQRPAWLPPAVQFRGIPFPRLWTHWRFARALHREPPDVVYVPSHVLPIRLRVPGVATIHDVGHRHERRTYPLLDWLYLEATTRYMARRAARLIADSERTAADLRRLYRVPADRITVIYPGVDPALRVPGPAEVDRVRRRYELPERYFVYVGRAHPRKNLPLLLRAFADARRQGLDAGLVLAGDGHSSVVLEGVRVLAYVPAGDLAPLYGGAIALTLPSRYEGFGFPVLEAMRCGTAVLASTAGSLPEVVGNAGILLNPRDAAAWSAALRQVAGDTDLQRRLIEAGFVWSERFSWSRAARQAWRVLENALTH